MSDEKFTMTLIDNIIILDMLNNECRMNVFDRLGNKLGCGSDKNKYKVSRFNQEKKNCSNDDNDCTYGNRLNYNDFKSNHQKISAILDFCFNNMIENDHNIFLIVCPASKIKQILDIQETLFHSQIISIDLSESKCQTNKQNENDCESIKINYIFQGFPNETLKSIIDCKNTKLQNETKLRQNINGYFMSNNITNKNLELIFCVPGNSQYNPPVKNKTVPDPPLTFLGFIQNEKAQEKLKEYLNKKSKNLNIQIITSNLNRAQHTALQLVEIDRFKNSNLHFLLFLFDKMAIQSLSKLMKDLDSKKTIAEACERSECYKGQNNNLFENFILKNFTNQQISWINDKIQNCGDIDLTYSNYKKFYDLVKNRSSKI